MAFLRLAVCCLPTTILLIISIILAIIMVSCAGHFKLTYSTSDLLS